MSKVRRLTGLFTGLLLGVTPVAAQARPVDRDGDGMSDRWERRYELNASFRGDARRDPDRDGLSNRAEFRARTNPRRADTDGDGMPDGWEVRRGLNPRVADAKGDGDRDGVNNAAEYAGDRERGDAISPGAPNDGPAGDAGPNGDATAVLPDSEDQYVTGDEFSVGLPPLTADAPPAPDDPAADASTEDWAP
jgi:hypothetical protein